MHVFCPVVCTQAVAERSAAQTINLKMSALKSTDTANRVRPPQDCQVRGAKMPYASNTSYDMSSSSDLSDADTSDEDDKKPVSFS